MTQPLRIALVDDQDLVRSGFHMILDAQKDMSVVGQACDGIDVLPMVKTTHPDIVLMDIRMPTLDGISATRAVLDTHPDLKVLILTTFDLDDYLVAAMQAGASGFLLKDATAPELLAGIRAVARGDSVVAPSATRRLLKQWFAPTGPVEAPRAHSGSIEALSDREREILTLIGRAMSNNEIAQHLDLAESTIKSHINRILHKLELRDRAQLIVLAYESGLVRVGE
ncbi:response regulator transcription factor [uncultured Actinomyces sp.]|uniref:response regulator transcription factor n=1 Tax=uncultured Actinomyces sp. TaxID=249061 RepID=UPI0028D57965|nr:response regulator transcription factor [uncultured Actinomyces sp.]